MFSKRTRQKARYPEQDHLGNEAEKQVNAAIVILNELKALASGPAAKANYDLKIKQLQKNLQDCDPSNFGSLNVNMLLEVEIYKKELESVKIVLLMQEASQCVSKMASLIDQLKINESEERQENYTEQFKNLSKEATTLMRNNPTEASLKQYIDESQTKINTLEGKLTVKKERMAELESRDLDGGFGINS